MLVPEFRAYHRGILKDVQSISLNHDDVTFQNGVHGYYRGSLKDCELSQYLGIRDKVGKKLFSGDTVVAEVLDSNNVIHTITGIVCLGSYEIELETNDRYWPVISWSLVQTFTIIGNKYENGDIMEEDHCKN